MFHAERSTGDESTSPVTSPVPPFTMLNNTLSSIVTSFNIAALSGIGITDTGQHSCELAMADKTKYCHICKLLKMEASRPVKMWTSIRFASTFTVLSHYVHELPQPYLALPAKISVRNPYLVHFRGTIPRLGNINAIVEWRETKLSSRECAILLKITA
jgi:hypothetical protein